MATPNEIPASKEPQMAGCQQEPCSACGRAKGRYYRRGIFIGYKCFACELSEEPVYGVMDPDYARFISMARCIAKAEGYALALHGSFSRDLDVIAIPWVEKPNSDPSQLATQIAERTGLRLHPQMQIREHGRMTWAMHFKTFGDPRFIDFSVMPLLTRPLCKNEWCMHEADGFCENCKQNVNVLAPAGEKTPTKPQDV